MARSIHAINRPATEKMVRVGRGAVIPITEVDNGAERTATYIPPIDAEIDHRDPELRKVAAINGLDHNELRVLHARLRLPTKTQDELGELLGIAAVTVGGILRREHVRDAMQQYMATEFEKSAGARIRALHVLEDLLESPRDATRLQAAKAILIAVPHAENEAGNDEADEQASMFAFMLQQTAGTAIAASALDQPAHVVAVRTAPAGDENPNDENPNDGTTR